MSEALREGDDISKGGVKFDDGKYEWHRLFGIKYFYLIPVEAMAALAAILGFGARKYAPRNWEQGMDWSRPFNATIRHLDAWWGGEDKDKDSGKSHLWHAFTNVAFLLTYEVRGKGKDDRPTATNP